MGTTRGAAVLIAGLALVACRGRATPGKDASAAATAAAACEPGTDAAPAEDAAPAGDAAPPVVAIDAGGGADLDDEGCFGPFDGRPGWLLLGEHFKAYGPAHRRATERDAAAVATELFSNLKPGFVALVHGCYVRRADAVEARDELRLEGIDTYVKQSGTVVAAPGQTAPARLVAVRGSATAEGVASVEIELELPTGAIRVVTGSAGDFEVWTAASGPGSVRILHEAKDCLWCDQGNMSFVLAGADVEGVDVSCNRFPQGECPDEADCVDE